jgi:hypothetical protein
VIVRNASEHGVEPGDFLDVEVTGAESVYCFAEPVDTRGERERAVADD